MYALYSYCSHVPLKHPLVKRQFNFELKSYTFFLHTSSMRVIYMCDALTRCFVFLLLLILECGLVVVCCLFCFYCGEEIHSKYNTIINI